ncbi:FmdB family zinc ribbon protein [Nonomuraea sp. H19]|uniref:FmdB family zinc ribbon protein n=1 Tax=Nonomuraea sp. H19 TaxID=3452206 RepID=UPI003F8C9B1D
MAAYQYHCAGCGPFDVRRPLGEARPEEPCEACGHHSRRVYTSPMLTRTPTALARALHAQEASAHEPRVVSEVPASRRGPAVSTNPRHALLPKP